MAQPTLERAAKALERMAAALERRAEAAVQANAETARLRLELLARLEQLTKPEDPFAQQIRAAMPGK